MQVVRLKCTVKVYGMGGGYIVLNVVHKTIQHFIHS